MIIAARDSSWRGFFEGNWARIEQDVAVKFTPPRLEVLSSPLPVSQGGAGVVAYRVSDDGQRYGVQIGETFFSWISQLRASLQRVLPLCFSS